MANRMCNLQYVSISVQNVSVKRTERIQKNGDGLRATDGWLRTSQSQNRVSKLIYSHHKSFDICAHTEPPVPLTVAYYRDFNFSII